MTLDELNMAGQAFAQAKEAYESCKRNLDDAQMNMDRVQGELEKVKETFFAAVKGYAAELGKA